MHALFEYLAEMPLVYLFLVIGLGALAGRIKFGKIRLGAAMVLFVAIAITAIGVPTGITLQIPALIGDLGLALFAFAIGITSGPSFFDSIKRAWPTMIGVAVILVLAGVVAFVLGNLLGLPADVIAGTYAGALNNTPALAAAGSTPGATVGYAVAYLYGVVGILLAINLALAYSKSDTDAPEPLAEVGIRVDRDDRPLAREVVRRHHNEVHFNRLRHREDGPAEMVAPGSRLFQGDVVSVVGPQHEVEKVIKDLGHESSHHLSDDRRVLDFRRITVSDPKVAGRQIRSMALEERFHSTISRIRRGDVDMVATADTVLQLGDRIRVVAPRNRMDEVTRYFGDSARGLSDINPLALGLGLTIGMVIGHIAIPLPGGTTLSLGAAAGALIVGLLMGRVGRIGGVVTSLPNTAAMALNEFGLMVFLAYAGTRAGGQIVGAFVSGEWWQILLLGLAITTTMGALAYAVGRWVFRSGGTRLAGGIAGMNTQPALLAYANERSHFDQRISLGYALSYPMAMIAKILVATVLAVM